MAITATVTKIWPTLSENGLFNVGVEVVLKDNDVEVKRKTFAENTTKAADVSLLAAQLTAKAQVMIDAYKSEKLAYNHAKMTTLVSNIQSGLVL